MALWGESLKSVYSRSSQRIPKQQGWNTGIAGMRISIHSQKSSRGRLRRWALLSYLGEGAVIESGAFTRYCTCWPVPAEAPVSTRSACWMRKYLPERVMKHWKAQPLLPRATNRGSTARRLFTVLVLACVGLALQTECRCEPVLLGFLLLFFVFFQTLYAAQGSPVGECLRSGNSGRGGALPR
ncbi:hypothetical protein NDU88_002747 [Pleurodeles waltl]|uniref:Uncharacterized protein n=1 Tax=Pleurodeles waltl TaxID=8319 RepID=A0AAV7QAV9_PLEWA|nr:hypothetical protein NDU88_002747 [Pleurodeles waltl]